MRFLNIVSAAAAVAVATAALPVLAIDPPPGTTRLQEESGKSIKPNTLNEHVSGTVTQVDHISGNVVMQAPEGILRLHFPTAATDSLRTGDRITVRYAFLKSDMLEKETRAYDVPKSLGEHRIDGTVDTLDRNTGWVSVATEYGVLALHFEEENLKAVRPGDRVTLEMAFDKES